MAGIFDLLGLGAGNPGTIKTPGRSPLGTFADKTNSLLDGVTSNPTFNLGIGLLAGKNAQEQMTMGLGGFREASRSNKTIKWLKENDPELAAAVSGGMLDPKDAFLLAASRKKDAAEALKPQRQWVELGDGTFGWADKSSGSFTKLGSAPKASDDANKFGLTPVWGVDPATNETRLGQISSDGTFKVLDLPPGFRPSTGTGTVDLGTEVGTVDRRTGQIISRTPKDNRSVARDKDLGQADAAAMVALPGARSSADDVGNQVTRLKKDPYLDSMLGPLDSRMPNLTEDAARVQGYMDQLQGGAFLQGRTLLKGGGAITDFESKKAEDAFARLNAAQSPTDYKAALDDFNAAVQAGVQKLEQQARGGGNGRGAGSTGGDYSQSSTGIRWRAK